MSDEIMTTLIVRLDSARAELRAARGGLAFAREYDVWDSSADVHAPTRVIGDLIEVVGSVIVVSWAPTRLEVLESLESFDTAYPDRRLVLRQSGDAATLRAMLMRGPDQRSDGLTAQDLRVIRLLAEGKSTKEIAQAMRLAMSTVKNRLSGIYAKVGVVDRTQLVLKALDMRLLPAHQT